MEGWTDLMGWGKAPLQKVYKEKDKVSWSGGWTEWAGTATVCLRHNPGGTEMPDQESNAPRDAGVPALQATTGYVCIPAHICCLRTGCHLHNWWVLKSFIQLPPSVKIELCIPRNTGPSWKRMYIWTPIGRRKKCNTQKGCRITISGESSELGWMRSWETCSNVEAGLSLSEEVD